MLDQLQSTSKLKQDWTKLLKYAGHYNVKVNVLEAPEHTSGIVGDMGSYRDETNTIEIYKEAGQSAVSLCLVFMHELGHFLDFMHSGYRVDDQTLLAYEYEEECYAEGHLSPLEYRYYIYESECRGINYMEDIWLELNLSIPYKRVKAEQQVDRLIYKHYYLHGEYPNDITIYRIRKSLLSKYSNWRRPRTGSEEFHGDSVLFPGRSKHQVLQEFGALHQKTGNPT